MCFLIKIFFYLGSLSVWYCHYEHDFEGSELICFDGRAAGAAVRQLGAQPWYKWRQPRLFSISCCTADGDSA